MEPYQINKRLRIYLKALYGYVLVNTVILAASFLMGTAFNQNIAIATGLFLWLFSFIAFQAYIDRQLFPIVTKRYQRFVRVSTIILVVLTLFFCEFYIRELRGYASCLAYDPDNNPFHYFLSMTWKTVVLWELAAQVVNRRTVFFSGAGGKPIIT